MNSNYEKRIIRVLEYIHENPGRDLSLDCLADVAAMSRFHWHRVFHAMTGETCAQAVRKVRLNIASHRLIFTDLEIAKIATQVGYDNEKSFTRLFTEKYGMSPNLFRKQGGYNSPNNILAKGDYLMFDVRLENSESRKLHTIFHKGPYEESGKAFEKLIAMATSRKIWPNVTGIFGVHWDNPETVPAQDLRTHAGLQLKDETTAPEELEPLTLQGGSYAILHYKGPYTAIKSAYDYLFGEWLPNSGKEPADAPCFEVYLNNPAETPPEELLTEIHLPLAA